MHDISKIEFVSKLKNNLYPNMKIKFFSQKFECNFTIFKPKINNCQNTITKNFNKVLKRAILSNSHF